MGGPYLVGKVYLLVWVGPRFSSLIRNLLVWVGAGLLSLSHLAKGLLVDDPLAQEYKAVLKLIDSLETIPQGKDPFIYIRVQFNKIESMLINLRAQRATHPHRLEPLKADFHLCACYWVYLTCRLPADTATWQDISMYNHPYEAAQVDLRQHAKLPGGAKAAKEYEAWMEQQKKDGYVGQTAKCRVLAQRAERISMRDLD
jgi:hypothetical protein